MSDHTGIAWTDATWNPIRGCTRVSEGCRHCYAETVAHRFGGPGLPYEGLTNARGQWNGTIRVVDEHLLDPLRWQRPRKVFVNSMSDLFHENVSDETIDRVFAVMALAPRHTFQVLTKRPERMLSYLTKRIDPFDYGRKGAVLGRAWTLLGDASRRLTKYRHEGVMSRPWPLPNVWLGVSVEDQATADARIPLLLQTPAAVRFISAEPLLGSVDLSRVSYLEDLRRALAGFVTSHGGDGEAEAATYTGPAWLDALRGRWFDGEDGGDDGPRLDWVVVGGESGPGARPCRVAWIRDVVAQCKGAGVAAFVKQLGANPEGDPRPPAVRDPVTGARTLTVMQVLEIRDRKGDDPAEWPEDLRVQEFPAVRA